MIKRYKCVVVANGLFPTGQQALELLRQAEFVVACDGAVIGLENGRLPDAVVGELDSLPKPLFRSDLPGERSGDERLDQGCELCQNFRLPGSIDSGGYR